MFCGIDIIIRNIPHISMNDKLFHRIMSSTKNIVIDMNFVMILVSSYMLKILFEFSFMLMQVV